MDGSARGDGGLMATLVCLGLGYCARHYVGEFGKRFDRIVGTTRSAQRAAALAQERLAGRPADMLVFDGITPWRELAAAIARADALLISAAPADGRDPLLAALEHEIAQAIGGAFARRADGVFNVVDDEPASPSGQIAFAGHLIGIDPPPEIPYAEAGELVSPMTLSFYDGCIRARNEKLKAALGVRLRYPTYRDGLRALYAAGDHLAVAGPAAPANP